MPTDFTRKHAQGSRGPRAAFPRGYRCRAAALGVAADEETCLGPKRGRPPPRSGPDHALQLLLEDRGHPQTQSPAAASLPGRRKQGCPE